MAQDNGKEAFKLLIGEVFGMIEGLDIQEGLYLQFADMFKQMNMNIDRLSAIRTQVVQNVYYQRYIRTTRPTLTRKKLSEAEKRMHPDYSLCDCGRYMHHDYIDEHLETLIHFQGRRNRKYAGKGLPDGIIKDKIDREVILTHFCLKHANSAHLPMHL